MSNNSTARERIIRRIRGLQSKTLDAGATQAEAEQAMAMAAVLMAEHDIAAHDLDAPTFDVHQAAAKAAMTRETVQYGCARRVAWVHNLAAFISATLVGQCATYSSTGPVRITFYGDADHVADAIALWDEWRRHIAEQTTRLYGGYQRGTGRSYALGFVDGLRQRVREEMQAAKTSAPTSSGTALVALDNRRELNALVRRRAATWLRVNQGVRPSSGAGAAPARNAAAYGRGRAAGLASSNRTAVRRLA